MIKFVKFLFIKLSDILEFKISCQILTFFLWVKFSDKNDT